MTIQQIHQLSIKMGMESDLRGKAGVQKMLGRIKKKFEKLSSQEKKEFDQEKLTNPYPDSRVLIDKPGKQIKKVLVGIDIGSAEIVLAQQLGGIDLIISHHPLGKGLADLEEVMKLQADVLNLYGVPINIAESLLKLRIEEVSRGVAPVNLYRAVDAAKLLGFGLMSCHTVCDNLVAKFLDRKIKKNKPEYVEDVLESLKEISEYQEAVKLGFGPRLFAGSPERRAGKIALTEITGGTEGSPKIYEKMAQAGIGTIVGMHLSEKHRAEAEKAHLNVVIAGHISSDSLGMNLFLDELEKKGITIIPCSGLIRVKRFKTRS